MRRLRTAAGLLVVAAMAVACTADGGGDRSEPAGGDGGAGSAYRVGMLGADSRGAPVRGGTLTFGAYAEPRVLDPARTIAAGATGGLELAAVYDVLMRWDSAKNTVVPQLAESLESSEDSRTWTLKLRPGVTFSDGQPLTAGAVKWSLERYVEKGADEAMLWKENVEEVRTPDEHTVVFRLAGTWPSFDHMLTTGPGMIVAKSSDTGGEFEPVGAGPFTFARHAPREELVLDANEDYWDGRPNLDRLRVLFMSDPHASLESFRSDSIDAVFLRDAELVDKALAEKHSGYLNMVALGNVAVINAAKDRPGADPRVRQAMHRAIDPELVARRAQNGAGVADNAIFPDFSRWHTDVVPLPYDPEAARKLLAQAKADGFDGKVTYLDAYDPASRATAVTVKSALEHVGFEVELDLVRTIADQITKVSVDRDYDVAGWGVSWREAGPYGRMFATLHSEGNLSSGMHTGPEMDALFEEFQAAGTEDEQREVMGRVQEQWNKDVPALVYGPTAEFLAWSDEVQGVVDTANSMILLDDAWLDG